MSGKTLAGLTLVCLLATTPSSAVPQVKPLSYGRVAPAPETRSDPSLTAFLDQLRDLVRRRDAKALLRVIEPKIDITFGQAQGRAAFARHWELSKPKSRFWHDVEWLLTLNGDYAAWGDYCLPYAFDRFPDEYDGAYGVIVRADEPLRAEPASDVSILTRLSYDIVLRDHSVERPYDRYPDEHGEYGPPWVKVSLGDGRRGYVRAESFWQSVGPRLCMGKIDGRWRITAYTVGD